MADARSRDRLTIVHLYPEAMDLYGDIGNVLALRRRCQWRGIDTIFTEVRVGDDTTLADADLIVIGGGQDSAQSYVAADLRSRGPEIRERIAEGAAALAVCGGFQLFGTEYRMASGATLEGVGVFDARSEAGQQRFIGNVAIETSLQRYGAAHAQPPIGIVGFENHAGITRLGPTAKPFGRVVRGAGNLGDGTMEGAVYRNAIGTYLHGPLLPKNPRLADHLIIAALAHLRGEAGPLPSLHDVIELEAHLTAARRCDDEVRSGSARRRLAG